MIFLIFGIAAAITADTSSANPAPPPSTVSSELPKEPLPLSCEAARNATADIAATMNARFVPERPMPSPLGRRYIELSESLSVAMNADKPNFETIGALWHQLDRLRVQIAEKNFTATTECTLDRLRLMAPENQREALRRMAPPSKADRERMRATPVAPPPPPRLNEPRPKQ
jgi:hypothetical protein